MRLYIYIIIFVILILALYYLFWIYEFNKIDDLSKFENMNSGQYIDTRNRYFVNNLYNEHNQQLYKHKNWMITKYPSFYYTPYSTKIHSMYDHDYVHNNILF